MKLWEHLDVRNILLDLEVRDRDDCLRRAVESLAGSGAISEVEDPLRRLIEREEVMSTGIHPGVAVPHAYTEAAARTVCALVRVSCGVDFKSLDGGPVHLVFCLLAPPQATDHHVKLLARLARLIEMPGVLDDLNMAGTADSLLTLLKSAERRMP